MRALVAQPPAALHVDPADPDIVAARAFGVDIGLLIAILQRTPAERLSALEGLWFLRGAARVGGTPQRVDGIVESGRS